MASYRLITDAERTADFCSLGLASTVPAMHLHVYHSIGSEIPEAIRQQILAVNRAGYTAIAVPERRWKAVFFDMDSTVIAEESIVELARAAGKAAEVHFITEQAMTGVLDFKTALKKRVAMLRGLPAQVIDEVAQGLTINPGMKEFSAAALSQGLELYLVSGGFNPLARKIAEELGFTAYHANELAIHAGELTGELLGEIIDGEAKARYLQKICQLRGFAQLDTVAVGDGANDLPMMQLAGAAIGYHPKSILLPFIHGANLHDHRVLVHSLL